MLQMQESGGVAAMRKVAAGEWCSPAEKNVLHSKLVHLHVHVQAYLPTYLVPTYLPHSALLPSYSPT